MKLISIRQANETLLRHHYLGPTRRGFALGDHAGVMVFARPSSRRLPMMWLELVRWCIVSREKNAGSQQWRAAAAWLKQHRDETTIISYSDPAAGHTGALYRACNWDWAPTWHRLRPPPSGNGEWTRGQKQAVKDRWVFRLRPDASRAEVLPVDDASVVLRMPWASWTGDRGGDFKRWKREIAEVAA